MCPSGSHSLSSPTKARLLNRAGRGSSMPKHAAISVQNAHDKKCEYEAHVTYQQLRSKQCRRSITWCKQVEPEGFHPQWHLGYVSHFFLNEMNRITMAFRRKEFSCVLKFSKCASLLEMKTLDCVRSSWFVLQLGLIGAATFVPGHPSPATCAPHLAGLLRSHNPPKHLRMKLIFCALISYATIFGVSAQTYNFKSVNFVCNQSPYLNGWCGRPLAGSSISLAMAPAGDTPSGSFDCTSLSSSMSFCCSPGVLTLLFNLDSLRQKQGKIFASIELFLHPTQHHFRCEDMPKKLSQVPSAEEGLAAKRPTLAGEESPNFFIFLSFPIVSSPFCSCRKLSFVFPPIIFSPFGHTMIFNAYTQQKGLEVRSPVPPQLSPAIPIEFGSGLAGLNTYDNCFSCFPAKQMSLDFCKINIHNNLQFLRNCDMILYTVFFILFFPKYSCIKDPIFRARRVGSNFNSTGNFDEEIVPFPLLFADLFFCCNPFFILIIAILIDFPIGEVGSLLNVGCINPLCDPFLKIIMSSPKNDYRTIKISNDNKIIIDNYTPSHMIQKGKKILNLSLNIKRTVIVLRKIM
ncbi:hypothetical protein VP01_4112g2 [Puccinia sorghi]|uniref:Uncharacterized protein n=1 Tax=Puccinia sorghi TaxID=27349 RepID=A0A0L6UT55_9BASI|nr:hypothetical protein VP01_4112g2 [Puccinia sorghi]